MGNRSIQQKLLKMKKAKRLFPKRFASEYIPVSTQGIDKSLLNEGNARAKSGIPNVFLKGTTSYQEAELRARNAYIQAMFPEYCVDPHTNEPYKVNEPRKEAKHAVNRAKIGELLADVPLERNVVLTNNGLEQLRLFWTAEGVYFMVKVDLIFSTIQRTINYSSRSAVFDARRAKRLRWKKAVSLDT